MRFFYNNQIAKLKNLSIIINFYIISLPFIYLLKHNFAHLLVSIVLIFFLFRKIININYLKSVKFVFIFFIYILFQSSLNENLFGLYYLRFFLLLLLIVYCLDISYIKKIIFLLKFLLFFFCIDVIFQNFTGYNLLLINNQSSIPTSFFRKEVVGGTYLLNITIIFLVFTAFTNDLRSLKHLMIFSPILIYVSFISYQRMASINYILILTLMLITFFYLYTYKKKVNDILKIILFFLMLLTLSFYFLNLPIIGKFKLLSSYFNKKENFATITFINYDGFEKIIFEKKNFLRLASSNDNENNLNGALVIGYQDVFAKGYLNGELKEIRISDINHSNRLFGKYFTFQLSDDSISQKISKYYGLSSLNSDQYIEYLNKFSYHQKGQWVASLRSTEKVEVLISDTGWYSHFYTAWNIWKEHKFFGSGIKKFRELCPDKKYWDMKSLSNVYCTTHPHNFFIELLAEVGIFGLILFYLIIVDVVFRILKSDIKINIKILLIGIILIMFQPLQTSGRFFSSNISLFNFYILGLYYYFLINLKKNNNS